MQLDKPQMMRTQVTARDLETGKSKTITVYNTTPEEYFSNVERLAKADFDSASKLVDQLLQFVGKDAPAKRTLTQLRDFIDSVRPTEPAVA